MSLSFYYLLIFVTCLQVRMADPGSGDSSGQRVPTPGGSNVGMLVGRRPSTAISPGRLPSMRSRDLTLGGVKKVIDSVAPLLRIMIILKMSTCTIDSSIISFYSDFVCVPLLNFRCCVLYFRKLLHPTSLAEKLKKSKFKLVLNFKRNCRENRFFGGTTNNFVNCKRTKVEGGQRRERRDGDRGRGSRERGRGRGRPEVIQSHSIFEQGPAEMMMKKRGRRSAG